jgi:hypothetical protein
MNIIRRNLIKIKPFPIRPLYLLRRYPLLVHNHLNIKNSLFLRTFWTSKNTKTEKTKESMDIYELLKSYIDTGACLILLFGVTFCITYIIYVIFYIIYPIINDLIRK